MKKNIFSIYALDAKGISVYFVYVQVMMCPRGNTIEDATIIGEENKDLYKLKGKPKKKLVHESIEPSELWNRRLTHVN